ncbi:MAG: pilus assembly protein N-terminal domain-containing protein [Hyphomonadaceae bacterium]|jgi:Flp pilus assembly secretin CpaC|nr:pilus assembly protein N-terminal domain-containing protein [Hyphomonadaceae bacterium]
MRVILIAALSLLSTPALAQTMQLNVDEAQPLRMQAPITGVAVGNAGIADVIVHDANTLFVLGKSVGTTNVVAVDARGRTVFSGVVEVRANEHNGLVVVQRGPSNTTVIQCSDRCASVSSQFAPSPHNAEVATNLGAIGSVARGGSGN